MTLLDASAWSSPARSPPARVLLLDEVAGGLVEHETAALVDLINDVRAPACRSSGSSTSFTR
jgi:hypothetical protein